MGEGDLEKVRATLACETPLIMLGCAGILSMDMEKVEFDGWMDRRMIAS